MIRHLFFFNKYRKQYPAATAELYAGNVSPMACISRKLDGFFFVHHL